MQIRVVNRILDRQVVEGGTRIYVGRPTVLGNPFVIGRDGTRRAVIDRYESYLRDRARRQDSAVLAELGRISELAAAGPVELSCSCSPMDCHADVIKKLVLERATLAHCASSSFEASSCQ